MNKTESGLSVKDLWAGYYKGRENGDGEFYRNKLMTIGLSLENCLDNL